MDESDNFTKNQGRFRILIGGYSAPKDPPNTMGIKNFNFLLERIKKISVRC